MSVPRLGRFKATEKAPPDSGRSWGSQPAISSVWRAGLLRDIPQVGKEVYITIYGAQERRAGLGESSVMSEL